MKKRICLITPGHIASNPRLVKEAIALQQANMQIHIIFSQYVPYLVDHDKKILKSNPAWTYEFLDWTGSSLTSKLTRYCSAISQKLAQKPESKINRNFRWQLKKAINCGADLYIGHNLGALPVAVLAAERNGAKSGFDLEDFHRHQITDDLDDEQVKLTVYLEEKYIPYLNYLTAAGDLIAEKYSQLFNMHVVSIANVFPRQAAPVVNHSMTDPLKLFWFSQTIGPTRGLEEVIVAIGLSKLKMELHLLGEISTTYRNHLQSLSASQAPNCSLNFYSTIYPDNIFQFEQQFDIGLATEIGVPVNRDICLTNKIFTYIQGGLCVIASDTTAQRQVLQQYPTIGKTFDRANHKSLSETLSFYHQNREMLFEARKAASKLAREELNWEKESQKFLNQVKRTLNL